MGSKEYVAISDCANQYDLEDTEMDTVENDLASVQTVCLLCLV